MAKNKTRSGRSINPFADAMKEINRDIDNALKKRGGARHYYTRYDCRAIYDKWNGHCSKCGLALQSKSNFQNSAYFTFRVPLDLGGKMDRDNLLLVCFSCKTLKIRPKVPMEDRVVGFDSFADLIVQLTASVVEKDESKIKWFKHEVNRALGEIVQTLYHDPIGDVEPVERYENDNSVSDLVADIAEDLSAAFREISGVKQYVVLRRNHR